ncbi:MAG TPA: methyltransferase domain-containing protein [Syntrophorhabdaceae bacterium]|nr:methyltransferase domain-containing protein [Syntrophorhabdaceae bacterium]
MEEARKPHGAGRSAFDLIDTDRVFEALNVRPSTVILDLGAGAGNYTVRLAETTGPGGRVFALDAWEEGLARVRERASLERLGNIETLLADANESIPLEDGTIDLCLVATVLHDLLRDATGETVLSEILRVLKRGGKLAVLEFKKIEGPPGPPLRIRLSEKDVEGLLAPFGFHTDSVSDVGEYHYLLIASLPG